MADVSARNAALLRVREHDFPNQGPEGDDRLLTRRVLGELLGRTFHLAAI
jgi:hypothetical protein